MIDTKTARAVIAERTHGGDYLYMSDEAKISSWLDIPVSEVKSVLDRLIAENALRYEGRSRTGSHKFRILTASADSEAERDQLAAERSAGFVSASSAGYVSSVLPITDEPTF